MFYKIKQSILHIKRSVCFRFSVIFCLVIGFCLLPFLLNHKSLIWPYDGLTIQYPAFIYLGQFIRESIKSLFDGNFSLIDFNIGMGTDIIQFLGMWYFEPLGFISALVPIDNAETVYNVLVLIRFYLIGISFLQLCKYFGKYNTYAIIGALVYTFSGYTFYFIKHPIFFWGLIYLPLFIILVDKIILNNQFSLKLSLLTGISLMTAYQLLYINTLLLAIYILIRCFNIYGFKKWKRILNILLKIIFSYLLGIGMACITFIPVFIGYLNSNRTTPVISTDKLFSYGPGWVSSFFAYLIAPNKNAGYWLYNGYAVIIVIAIVLLFYRKKEYVILKKLLLILTVMFSMPCFTFVLFGFNSINHRWSYAYGLLLAFITVYTLEYLPEHNFKKSNAFIIIGAIYTALIFENINLRSWETYISCIFYWALLSILFYLKLTDKSRSVWKRTLLLCVILICTINGLFTYSAKYGNYVSEFEASDNANQDLFNSSANIEIDDDEFYRRDAADNTRTHLNTAMINGYKGVSICSNQMSKYLFDFNNIFENRNYTLAEMFDLDNRTFLETLCGVKYFTLNEGQENLLPYGFSYTDQIESRGIALYKNDYFLPLGFTYSGYINYDDYANMKSYEKQEALLQGCVLNDQKMLEGYSEIQPEITSKKIDYTLQTDENLLKENDSYYVTGNSSILTFSCKGEKNSEVYFRAQGFNCDNLEFQDVTVTVTGRSKSKTISKTFNVRNASNQYTSGRYNYLINLGIFDDEIEEIQVTLPTSGEYIISNFEIICQPICANYSDYISDLGEYTLNNVTITGNKINGTITLDEAKILYLYIPYSKGWKATVDGDATNILRANEMFMAIPLDSGNHTVELNYRTPGLLVGICISIFSCFIFVGIFYIKQVNKKRCKTRNSRIR